MTPTTNRAATADQAWATDITLAITAAIHEAGHAVAHVVVGRAFDRVTVRKDATGWTGSVDPEPGARIPDHQFMTEAVILLAGGSAQVELLERITDANRDDIVGFARSSSSHDLNEVAALGVDELRAEIHAVALVRHWWSSIHRLAKAITEAPGTTLGYDEVLDVLGPRLGAVGTRAHRRQLDRAARDYAAGTRLTYVLEAVERTVDLVFRPRDESLPALSNRVGHGPGYS